MASFSPGDKCKEEEVPVSQVHLRCMKYDEEVPVSQAHHQRFYARGLS